MMRLLAPLGLIGLLGVVALIIIYIIKPNYQQKFISSTYVWKLSLKYRKKKLPFNKLRNILLFICQLLAITIFAMIFAQPIIEDKFIKYSDTVIIIDGSANMLVETKGITRFERAVAQAKTQVNDVFNANGNVTVVLAGEEAQVIGDYRTTVADRTNLLAELDKLVVPNNLQCSFGSADMDGAIAYADEILKFNPKTEICLYTATDYVDAGNVTVKKIADSSEWNLAILDCTLELDENHFNFVVDVACYGRDEEVVLVCEIYNANGINDQVYSIPLQLNNNEEQRVVLNKEQHIYHNNLTGVNANSVVDIYSFESAKVYFDVSEEDSFSYDDEFYFYGGEKPELKVLYCSPFQNDFTPVILMEVEEAFRWAYDIEITEEYERKSAQLTTEGYDLYIYEHVMPKVMPEDGVVMLIDLDSIPEGLEVTATSKLPLAEIVPLKNGEAHDITSYIDASTISISAYVQITSANEFVELMYIENDPVLLLKDTPDQKILLFCIDTRYSDVSIGWNYPILFYNVFSYFFPVTFEDSACEVGDIVSFNARGEKLTITNILEEKPVYELEKFPVDVSFKTPGTYNVSQEILSRSDKGETKKLLVQKLFVKVPKFESNVKRVVDELPKLTMTQVSEADDSDLIIYFALVLVALLFIEWWLQAQSNMR